MKTPNHLKTKMVIASDVAMAMLITLPVVLVSPILIPFWIARKLIPVTH